MYSEKIYSGKIYSKKKTIVEKIEIGGKKQIAKQIYRQWKKI